MPDERPGCHGCNIRFPPGGDRRRWGSPACSRPGGWGGRRCKWPWSTDPRVSAAVPSRRHGRRRRCGRGGGAGARRHLAVLQRGELAGLRRPGRQAILLLLGLAATAAKHACWPAWTNTAGPPIRFNGVPIGMVIRPDHPWRPPAHDAVHRSRRLGTPSSARAGVWHQTHTQITRRPKARTPGSTYAGPREPYSSSEIPGGRRGTGRIAWHDLALRQRRAVPVTRAGRRYAGHGSPAAAAHCSG